MSTSLLVKKVNRVAQEQGSQMELFAMSESEARKDLSAADILLLGPQVRYLEPGFRRALEGSSTKLGVVDMLAYGRMDGEKVYNQILELAAQ
jgi:PTS system cellobiose-specific IIB component